MRKKNVVQGSIALLGVVALAGTPARALPSHDTPVLATGATDLGRADASLAMTLTVMLKMHDEATLDKTVADLYNPNSTSYRHWLTRNDLARYAPTPEELALVRSELEHHGFKIIAIDPERFSIRVRGTVATAESAFQTDIHSFSYRNKEFLAHTRDAQLTGSAGSFVASVAGLDRHQVHPMLTVAKDPQTGRPSFAKVLTTELAKNIKRQITNIPLSPIVTETLTTKGGNPSSTFTGFQYKATGLTVANTPKQLQSYYGMPQLYDLGLTGKGQTIALVEGYGYDAALSDANTFSTIFGLPLLTSKTFKTVYPEGKALDPHAGDLLGWSGEIALDISAVHSLAPDAKIVVVASAGQDNEDQIASIQYIINTGVARYISSSWENDIDIIAGPEEDTAFNTVLKLGAAQGFAFQFSSGDSGDENLRTPVGAPGVPSNSPFGTAVGGTSILNNPRDGSFFATGWGNDLSPLFPFQIGGFGFSIGGAGGGQSAFFAKPKWQSSLPGDFRLVPDVSALADPNTGAVVVVTINGRRLIVAGFGGTSLACPLFTAIWAISGEYAGFPLGQAAPALSRLKPGQITDVKPASPLTPFNVTGTFTDASGVTTPVSAQKMFRNIGLEGQKKFTSALFISNQSLLAVSFGTDTSLLVANGWDAVTGFGEPNGLPFVAAVAR